MGRGGDNFSRIRQILGQAWPRLGPRSSQATSENSRQAAQGAKTKVRVISDLREAEELKVVSLKLVNDMNHPLHRLGNVDI